jgi:cell division protein FtsL
MSERHHHHHHHEDDASRFKRRSINSIARRKKIARFLKLFLTIVAAVLVLVAFVLYFVL